MYPTEKRTIFCLVSETVKKDFLCVDKSYLVQRQARW